MRPGKKKRTGGVSPSSTASLSPSKAQRDLVMGQEIEAEALAFFSTILSKIYNSIISGSFGTYFRTTEHFPAGEL